MRWTTPSRETCWWFPARVTRNGPSPARSWRALAPRERGAYLIKWYDLIQEHKQDLARILSYEQGKPVAESLGEIALGSSYIPWYAEECRRTYGDVIPAPRKGVRPITHLQPVGVVFAITPWNFPMHKMADEIAQQSRARPLGWLLGGYRLLTNSKRPITTMADLKGLKIRVPAVELQLAAFRSWGVEPHPLSWSETFNALQQGVVDGQENPYAIIRDQKFWEVQKYVTDLHYMPVGRHIAGKECPGRPSLSGGLDALHSSVHLCARHRDVFAAPAGLWLLTGAQPRQHDIQRSG